MIFKNLTVKENLLLAIDNEDTKFWKNLVGKNPIAKEREIKALLRAMQEFKLKEGLVITQDYKATEQHKGKKIKFIQLWKWLL